MPTTNKELLDLVLQNQKTQGEAIYELSKKLSHHINEQTPINERLLGYLESNNKTNQKGGIERIGDLENRTSDLESTIKVTFGKASVIGVVFLAVGGFIFKVLNLIF